MTAAPVKRQRYTNTDELPAPANAHAHAHTHRPAKRSRSTLSPSSPFVTAPSTPPPSASFLNKVWTWLRPHSSTRLLHAHLSPREKKQRQQYRKHVLARSSPLSSSNAKPSSAPFEATRLHRDNIKQLRSTYYGSPALQTTRQPFKQTTPWTAMNSSLHRDEPRDGDNSDDDDQQYTVANNRRLQNTWDIAMARASGHADPASQMPLPPQRTPSVLSSYIKKKPMGQDKHQLEIRQSDADRQARLQRETFDAAYFRQQASQAQTESSLADYKRLASLKQAQDPLFKSSLTRVTSRQAKTADLLRRASATVLRDPREAHRIANDTYQAPRPETPTHDALVQRFEKVRLEVAGLDRPKERRRKFPKRLSRADQEIVDEEIFGDRGFASSIDGAAVEHRDIIRLRGLQWLNDEVITFYAQMINARAQKAEIDPHYNQSLEERGMRLKKVHCFNSFFYNGLSSGGHKKVKRWTKRVDLFSKDIVIVPINHGNAHWVCSAINIRDKRIEYYDSLNGSNPAVYKRLRDYIAEEHRVKKGKELDLSEWVDYRDDDVPQQANSSDCGVFTAQFMECLSREVDGFDFTQDQMP
ncbi:hypothetical protein OIV83_002335 [Microbotryomycetes sp. JL201]|nr:hypothetical protein OIV83_002335 [Microbotryomycetes sp. JL201]